MPISEAVRGNHDSSPKSLNEDQDNPLSTGGGSSFQARSAHLHPGGSDPARQTHTGHGFETKPEGRDRGTYLQQELMTSRPGSSSPKREAPQIPGKATENALSGSETPPCITTLAKTEGIVRGDRNSSVHEAHSDHDLAKDPKGDHIPVSEGATVVTPAGISGWSHQALAPHKPEVEEHKQEDEWQDMPAFAPYDIYNDDGKLVAREERDSDGEGNAYEGLGGAGKGYTRIQVDEDALSATSMDDNTSYLFKAPCTDEAIEDEEQRDTSAQLQATKDLLTEGQRIAYVGVTRLALALIVKELDDVESTKGTKKESKMAVESMKMWSQEMMLRLYAHMEIDTSGMLELFRQTLKVLTAFRASYD